MSIVKASIRGPLPGVDLDGQAAKAAGVAPDQSSSGFGQCRYVWACGDERQAQQMVTYLLEAGFDAAIESNPKP